MIFLIATMVIVSVTIKHLVPKPVSKDSQDALAALNERLERMERRLTNVETIVTGKDYQLNQEFESLKS